MRLKTEIWVKAYLRRCGVHGASAYVVRHGDDDAGAVYLKVSRLDGTAFLYGPAPAGLVETAIERQWIGMGRAAGMSEAEADAFLLREAGFDSDLWVVEVEDRQGRHFLGDELTRG